MTQPKPRPGASKAAGSETRFSGKQKKAPPRAPGAPERRADNVSIEKWAEISPPMLPRPAHRLLLPEALDPEHPLMGPQPTD